MNLIILPKICGIGRKGISWTFRFKVYYLLFLHLKKTLNYFFSSHKQSNFTQALEHKLLYKNVLIKLQIYYRC